MEFHHILLAPVVTEKSNAKQANRIYTFLVHPHANKIQVARAVEEAYGVKVTKVNMVTVIKKVRMAGSRGRMITKRPKSKKAFVTLGPKQTLDVNKFSKK